MNNAERVALADAALEAIKGGEPLTFTDVAPAGGDTPTPSASGQPTTETVTPAPTEAGKPDEVAGSDVSTTTQEQIVFPAWVPEGSKEAFRGLSKEAREAAFRAIEDRKVSIEADATRKWEEAATVKREAALWRTLRDDPVKGPEVLKILEAPKPAGIDPRMVKLTETLGEDAATLIAELIDAKADEKADVKVKAALHERLDAPNEHVGHVNEAATEFRSRLGNRVSDEEFEAAKQVVGRSLGWSPETPNAPYEILNPQNVAHYLSTALQAIRASSKPQTPAASPPKAPVAKPASVQSNGMATDTKALPPWKVENRPPKHGEAAAWTMRKAGITDADVDRMIRSM